MATAGVDSLEKKTKITSFGMLREEKIEGGWINGATPVELPFVKNY
jgi:hypothetical protein